MKRIYPDRISIRASGAVSPFAQFVNNEWQIKTDGAADERQISGSYIVLKSDGSVMRRTLDNEGYIIHEILIKKGTSDV